MAVTREAPTARDEGRYRANRQGELDSALVYRAMAAAERDRRLAIVYLQLAEVEERHLDFWEEQLRAIGKDPGVRRPSWRARAMALLARRFGAWLVVPTVATLERADQTGYDSQPETAGTGMRDDERSHARVLRYIAGGSPRGVAGETLARLEGRHRAPGGNSLRAAVLGANDGLTSNLALVMGVAGAGLPGGAILISGLTGLLAGASSMALGEWISVQSARELYTRQVRTEAAELNTVPDEEREELALIYQAKGLPAEEAAEVADRLMADHQTALDTMVREELGLDPGELGGSPVTAASSSFLLFAMGAVLPLIPFFAVSGGLAVGLAIGCAAVGLFAIGALITLLTGRSAMFSGSRQLVFGLLAAGVTFGIGRLIGLGIHG
ncbi:MAG TPA: VIT1/CCC1 transporter family protein [Candidatus Binatia bacterium]|nr:VIT1/CCC1 transporter family protein [Candidatus Binatia bacterium]